MRDHAIVSPHFWTGDTGRQLRKDPEAQRVAFYLMTCPSANMIGLYYLPIPLICHEVGLFEEGAYKALTRLSEVSFCDYDTPSEVVFVKQMARYQIGETLSLKDNRHVGVHRQLAQMKNCRFYNEFLERYGECFCLNLEPLPSPLKPLASKGKGKDKEKDLTPPTPPAGGGSDEEPKETVRRGGSGKVVQAKAKAVLDYFNTVHGRTFENASQIETLLRSPKLQEPTLEDCKLVIDYLYEVERIKNAEGYETYVDNVTPFRPLNFERHRERARIWDQQGRPEAYALENTHANPHGLTDKEMTTIQSGLEAARSIQDAARVQAPPYGTRGQFPLLSDAREDGTDV
jgi:hypothetical protein